MLPQQLRQLIYNKVNRDLDFDEYMVHKGILFAYKKLKKILQ